MNSSKLNHCCARFCVNLKYDITFIRQQTETTHHHHSDEDDQKITRRRRVNLRQMEGQSES